MTKLVAKPKFTKQQAAKINADFTRVETALVKAGFVHGDETKSKLFTMTYLKSNAKGYISIRYNPDLDHCFVMAEFYGRTKTVAPGIGIEARILDFTPRIGNINVYKNLDMLRCRRDFALTARFMIAAVPIFAAMRQF